MLKWLTKKVYNSLTDVLAAVYKELDSLQPVDTDTVKWTKGLTGMKAHAVVQNSPVAMNQVQGDEVDLSYKSSFKLIFGMTTEPEPDPNISPDPEAPPFVPEPCILLVQGADAEDDEAGVVTVVKRATALHVLKTELPIVDGDIYLNVIWNPSTGLTYSVGAAVPLNGNVYQARIGRYNAYNKTITQIHLTGDIRITDWPTAYDNAFLAVLGTASVADPPPDPLPEPSAAIYICHGKDIERENAGIVFFEEFTGFDNPFPLQMEVPKTELPAIDGNIYLIIYFDVLGAFTYEFYQGNITGHLSYGSVDMWYILIATYNASTQLLTQVHTGNQAWYKQYYSSYAYSDGDIMICSAANRYLGTFKVIRDWATDSLVVCNGGNYGGAIAGHVGPSPINIDVPRTVLPATAGTINLLVSYSGGAYSASLIQGAYTPGDQEWMTPIASYNATNHSINQLHTTGNITITGRWL